MTERRQVLDSSVAIDLCLGRLDPSTVAELEQTRFVAPSACRYEVGNFVRQAPHNGELSREDAGRVLAYFFSLDVAFREVDWPSTWAQTGRLTWGDAEHVALALDIDGGVLWTSDGKLARSQTLPEDRLRLVVAVPQPALEAEVEPDVTDGEN